MKRIRLLVVMGVAVASLGLGVPAASACQPDSPCPCAEEPTRTLNRIWNDLFHKNFVQCTF